MISQAHDFPLITSVKSPRKLLAGDYAASALGISGRAKNPRNGS